jgi:hypothetical protein
MHKTSESGMGQHHAMYRHFSIMLLLSFLAMFAFMYAMVDAFANVYAGPSAHVFAPNTKHPRPLPGAGWLRQSSVFQITA